jgi:hypothetical protein
MPGRWKVYKMVKGRPVAAGELVFTGQGAAELRTGASAEFAPALQAAWAEVSALPVIRMKWEEDDPRDPSGNTVRLMGRDVAKGSPDYADAVADLLSRRYGFFVTPAELG